MKTVTPPVEGVRVLSEDEIQQRLYGGIRGPRKTVPTVVSEETTAQDHPTFRSTASVWTGSEILTGEVTRLRTELISLRREKEQLAAQLSHWEQKPVPLPSAAGRPGAGAWISRVLGIVLLLGALAGLLSFNGKILQASPMGGGAAPYTIQMAVYDVKGMAVKAQGTLRDLGYDAFLVELPRKNGLPRYRVYIGSFVTKEEARLEAERLSSDPRFEDFKDAFVRFR